MLPFIILSLSLAFVAIHMERALFFGIYHERCFTIVESN